MNLFRRLVAATLSSVFVTLLAGCTVTRPPKSPVEPTNPFARGSTIPPPEYGTTFKKGDYRSLESDARPGVHFFHDAWIALQKGDVKHAISMYQVSASWAFKPAAYMLGLIYFRGQGVPVDRPLGAAWMRLAAERDTPLFVRANDAMTHLLSQPQRLKADQLFNELSKTYADKHALARATSRWVEVWHSQTGTRAGCHPMGSVVTSYPSLGGPLTGGLGPLQLGGLDSGTACENPDPYSPTFLHNPDNPMFQTSIGIVTVLPLEKVDKNGKPLKVKRTKPARRSVDGQEKQRP